MGVELLFNGTVALYFMCYLKLTFALKVSKAFNEEHNVLVFIHLIKTISWKPILYILGAELIEESDVFLRERALF